MLMFSCIFFGISNIKKLNISHAACYMKGLNASNLQKQRKDATFSASRKRAARDINAPDGEKMHSSDDSMVIESKAPEKTNGKPFFGFFWFWYNSEGL